MWEKQNSTCIVCDAPLTRENIFCKPCKADLYHSPYNKEDHGGGPRSMTDGRSDILRIEDYVVPQEIMDRAEIFEELNAQECRRHENKKVRDGLFQMWNARDLHKKK
tara:strand:- start:1728 stop:2048 length:321 start_codon:yes stop_codon:yes gene_type:complete